MKFASKLLAMAALLLCPAVALASAPSVSPISDVVLNAGSTMTLSVVAVDPDGDAITLTSSMPAFATLNAPTTGNGLVVTTVTLAPLVADVGVVSGSVTATANGETDVETFQITVNAAGSNVAPAVTAPATQSVNEGSMLTFTVTASDADAEAITSLTAATLPAGATFTSNASYTSGTFTWTPNSTQAGDYDVVFTASNALSGSATTHIHVVDVVVNASPNVTAPATMTVNEGQLLTIAVSATDADADHVTLTATGVPSGATFVDNGNNTGTFTWTPNSTQSGSYTVTFTGDDGHGGTGNALTVITVNDVVVGGGGTATAKMLGNFNSHRKYLCFRVEPVNGSFDVRDVDKTTIMLNFGGGALAALSSRTHVDFECDGDDDDGEDDECDECDHEDEVCPTDTIGCEVTLHVCFAMSDLVDFFGDQGVPDHLAEATITGTLTGGGTFTATIGSPRVAGRGHEKHLLHAKATPNPLNPRTKLSFTLSTPGRVRVAVYDVRGRFVKTLLDENRAAGDQSLVWDGSDSRNRRVSSGVYVFRIQAPEGEDIQRVAVVK